MGQNEKIPHDPTLDNSLSLMQEGYLFIKNRIDKYESNVFAARLLGQNVVCMHGEEAAELFYNNEFFQRNGAAPKRIQKTLFGQNAIQTMDGKAHHHRKALFMSLMTPDHEKHLAKLFWEELWTSIDKWERATEIILFDEMKQSLCKVACSWAGVPLDSSHLTETADDFYAMVDAFGAVGPRHWKGRRARTKLEDWITSLVKELRNGKIKAPSETPFYVITFHRDHENNLLDPHMAAIEIINVIRPIVAIATYITFSALALHNHPECKEKITTGDDTYLEMFAQEVRRLYPFGPFLGARARKDFEWKNCHFKEGMLVLLDMYGTNHNTSVWDMPHEFRPERFKEWNGSLYNFIPQGGGDQETGHRCPGEAITVEMMKTAVKHLVTKIEYEVPEQDLSFSLSRMPTLPESGFLMKNVRRK